MTLWKIGTSTLIQARLPAHHSLKTAAITHNAVRPAPRLTFPRLPQAHITRHEVLKSSVRATHIIFCFSKWKLVIDKNDIDNTPHVYLQFLQVNLKLYKDQDVCKLAHKYSKALNGICLGIGMTCSCTLHKYGKCYFKLAILIASYFEMSGVAFMPNFNSTSKLFILLPEKFEIPTCCNFNTKLTYHSAILIE